MTGHPTFWRTAEVSRIHQPGAQPATAWVCLQGATECGVEHKTQVAALSHAYGLNQKIKKGLA